MFNSVTWGQYILTIAILLICYYAFIGVRYYKWELLNLIGIKKIEKNYFGAAALPVFKNVDVNETHEDYLPDSASDVDISPLVQTFTEEVQTYLEQAAQNKIQKMELLDSLQIIVSKYPVLKNSEFNNDLMQIILNSANKQYPGVLQSYDVNKLLTV